MLGAVQGWLGLPQEPSGPWLEPASPRSSLKCPMPRQEREGHFLRHPPANWRSSGHSWRSVRKERLQFPGDRNHAPIGPQEMPTGHTGEPARSRPLCLAWLAANTRERRRLPGKRTGYCSTAKHSKSRGTSREPVRGRTHWRRVPCGRQVGSPGLRVRAGCLGSVCVGLGKHNSCRPGISTLGMKARRN